MLRIFLLTSLFLTGCATQRIPMPAPMPAPVCDGIKVGNICKPFTASDTSGAVTLGHSNDENIPKAAAIPTKP